MKKVVMILSILAVAALAVLNLTYDDSMKPDAVYPFTNQRITWGN